MSSTSLCRHLRLVILLAVFTPAAAEAAAAAPPVYCVAVSKMTRKQPEWLKVADALREKHGSRAAVLSFDESPLELLDDLRKARPRYLAIVARPEELDWRFPILVSRLTRRLDSDPYGDCLWGIITGYTAADALRIARASAPLTLRNGLGTTGFDQSFFENSLVISDGKKGLTVERGPDGVKKAVHPQDNEGLAGLFAEFWKKHSPGFLVSSSHATQFNLEMPFGQGLIVSLENRFHVLRKDQLRGFARFLRGVLFTSSEAQLKRFIDSLKAPVLVPSAGPRIWIGAGNCLLGDAHRSRNSMVVTALSAGGFHQVVGYTTPTWYGKMGWGVLRRFFQSAGRLTLSEAFFLQNQAIIEETLQRYPKLLAVDFESPDIQTALRDPVFLKAVKKAGYAPGKDVFGLVHDRDTVAFYGDPAWQARLRPGAKPAALTWTLKAHKGRVTLRLEASDAYKQEGFSALLPVRVPGAVLDPARGVECTLADDFILVRKTDLKPGETRTLTIRETKKETKPTGRARVSYPSAKHERKLVQ